MVPDFKEVIMPTLYLSAPSGRTKGGPYYRDFVAILQNCVGPDYAIYASIAAQIHPGTKVVVFDRDHHLQAEGTVASLTPKPSNHVQRYDVHILDLAQVGYKTPPPVNRCGVALV
jgi:hypothetical protein